MSNDPYHLERFVTAQADVYDQVLSELRRGRKTSHWIWFVFPQLRGLGRSSAATHYGISSADEARAYLSHPLLGPRLLECTALVMDIPNMSLDAIFGYPDNLKFRSSMTLFAAAAPDEPLFTAALDKYCDGKRDTATMAML